MTTRKVIVGAAIVAVVAVGATVAHGYFAAAPATGVGQGRTATFEGLTNVELGATVGGLLVPGGDGDLVLRVHNGNAFPLAFTVTADTSGATSSAPGCPAPSVLDIVLPEVQAAVPVGADESPIVTMTGIVHLHVDAPSACQGAIFTIPVTATAEVTR
jgi:hypothetical protein